MGIPDFLKFAARTSPTALCRIPKVGSAASLCFDFVLVDATNACQTIGLQTLAAFLKQPQLKVRRAIIFAVDSQRHRAGTSRSHRTFSSLLDTDVAIRQLCGELQRHFAQQSDGTRAVKVLISGRHVAGEADYKILDIQRQIVMQMVAAGREIPTFCLVSEDSDVLCGALCGPAPHTVSIATKLHDTVFEMCLMRVTHVLAYVAQSVDVFGGVKEEPSLPISPPPKRQKLTNTKANMKKENGKEEESIVRRKKKDGPMVATGTRVVLSDSDSDQGGDEEPVRGLDSSSLPVISAHHLAGAEILQNSCVDLVFLFILVMGNGGNVPPVVRGATRVDIHSCWKAYCQMKYSTAECDREKEMGRSLFCFSNPMGRSDQQSNPIASIAVDCSFLRAILVSAHYADVQSRPPVEEEKEAASVFLSQAVYATFRYIVACNMYPNVGVENTFLDARPLTETQAPAPSLDAFLWVLGLTKKRTLCFPLVGLATEAVLSSATKGASDVDAAVTAGRSLSSQLHQNVVPQWDVENTLTAVDTDVSGFVRLQSVFLKPRLFAWKDVVSCINEYCDKTAANNNNNNNNSNGSSSRGGGGEVSRGNKTAMFSRLLVVWQRTIASFMPALEAITRSENFISPLAGHHHPSGHCGAYDNVHSAPTGSDAAGTNSKVKLSYSFELRRMAPVLLSDDKNVPTASATTNADTTTTTATMNASLLRALRVSYDYAQAPVAEKPPAVATRKRRPEREAGRMSSDANSAEFAKNKRRPRDAANASVGAGEAKSCPAKHRRPSKKQRQRAMGKKKEVMSKRSKENKGHDV